MKKTYQDIVEAHPDKNYSIVALMKMPGNKVIVATPYQMFIVDEHGNFKPWDIYTNE